MQSETLEVRLEFEYIIDDYKEEAKSKYYTNKAIIALLVLFSPALLAVIIFYFLGIISLFVPTPRTATALELILLLFTGIVLAVFYLAPYLGRTSLNGVWSTTPIGRKKQIVKINPECISFANIYGEKVYPWGHIFQVIEMKDFFVIYFNVSERNIIPKRVMNEDEIEQTINIISSVSNVKYGKQGLKNKTKEK